MKKQISKEKKYHYVKRYIDGESPTKLGREINHKVKSPSDIIFRWHRMYLNGGIMALEDKRGSKATGRPLIKRGKLDPNKMSKEELIEYMIILEDTIEIYEGFNKKKKMRSRFLYPLITLMNKRYRTKISWLCEFYEVSRSGYYNWIKNPIYTNTYNREWLKIIEEEYWIHEGVYGAERIWAWLRKKGKLQLSLTTVKRYLRFLGLKSKIRKPKKKREVKETTKISKNYIGMNFADNDSRSKVFTDTSEYGLQFVKTYFSAVLDANETLLGLEVSLRNNETLIQKNISKSVRKIGRKYYIGFDNAAFYKNKNMEKLISSTNGIRSYIYPGKSLQNRPIEYFWSILKQEYLNNMELNSIEDIEKAIPKIIFHYNHIRIQKNLNWKTPAQARV